MLPTKLCLQVLTSSRQNTNIFKNYRNLVVKAEIAQKSHINIELCRFNNAATLHSQCQLG